MSGFGIVSHLLHGRIPTVVAGTTAGCTRLAGAPSDYSGVADPTTAPAALPPAPPVRKAVGTDIPAPEPAEIVTTVIGAVMIIGVDFTRAAASVVDHRRRWTRRLTRLGPRRSFTGRTVRLLGQTRKRFCLRTPLAGRWTGGVSQPTRGPPSYQPMHQPVELRSRPRLKTGSVRSTLASLPSS